MQVIDLSLGRAKAVDFTVADGTCFTTAIENLLIVHLRLTISSNFFEADVPSVLWGLGFDQVPLMRHATLGALLDDFDLVRYLRFVVIDAFCVMLRDAISQGKLLLV